MSQYRPEDLDALERAVLGVLSIGLPPSRSAGSDTFRVDHVTAVVSGLMEGGPKEVHLLQDGIRVAPQFRERLAGAIATLKEKGLVAEQEVGMPAAAGGFESGLEVDMVDPDIHPVPLDRYLGQQCMETLFNIPDVYPFLMERYTKSGEVWRRLRAEGYGY
ncbi:MAG: hypothetical protein U5Q44_12845 [Dehalococcoidia bacterium]|nr:hypothetical protein [Dehalococcoidia bacterium]